MKPCPMEKLFEILHEDDEMLVINKPAGLVCHPTKTDQYSSLISRARLYLGEGSQPQLVNRLDRETSGVTVIAKTADAARELRGIWESRQVEKEYLALVRGHLENADGVIEAPLGRDEQSRVAIKDCIRADGAAARTDFWVLRQLFLVPPIEGLAGSPQPFSLLRVVPRTGRKHQIRIHLAYAGHPLVGEKLYGGDEDLYLALVENRLTPVQRERLILPNHALHARAVSFIWRGREVAFEAEPPPWIHWPVIAAATEAAKAPWANRSAGSGL